jgi:repressor LexA
MTELSSMERKIFDFVQDRLAGGQSAPTLRELAAKFGWRSSRAAGYHLEAIVRKGWLVVGKAGKARTLRLAASLKPVVHAVAEIPFLGSIPAGFPDQRGQVPGKCIRVAIESVGFKPTSKSFALQVTGDSMIGRHICDGDIALLEHGPEPRSGQILAALIDGEVTLKTFVAKGGKTFLKAENPKYPDLIPSQELVIQGLLKAIIRRAKE